MRNETSTQTHHPQTTGTGPATGGIWILAEQAEGKLQRIGHELLTRARHLKAQRPLPITAVVFGGRLVDAELQSLIDCGADRVVAVDGPNLDQAEIEPAAAALTWLINEEHPEILIAGATAFGRTVMPYLAIKANTGLTADCTGLDIDAKTGELLQTRPAIGGNILATIRTPNHRPQMATVRPRSQRAATAIPGHHGQIVRREPPTAMLRSRTRRLNLTPHAADQGSISEATAVVAVGRGIKKAANLPVARALADQNDAALGATRDVVDRGWLPYPTQIGLSGKTVTPRLYIGMGISGTIQHLAGMQTAETIIAINADPTAQIFKVADFGIVGDLFALAPAITERLQKRLGKTTAKAPGESHATTTKEAKGEEKKAVSAEASHSAIQTTTQAHDDDKPAGPIERDPQYAKGFEPVTPAIVSELQKIVGAGNVIFGDRDKLESYSRDEIADPEREHLPECVVRPASATEVAAIMKLANRARVPVTPRGAGSGLAGGCVPLAGGIVLIFDRLNKVIEVDPANMTMTVEPGVFTNEINGLVKDHGLFFAGYPMSLETCCIGGNVATNAGGGKAVKYGVTGRYVIGLEVVTPTGEILELGGKRVKDVSGYNLIPLMIGSEGTLGVFTKITLKLMPLPKASVDLLALFPTVTDAIALVPKIMTKAGIIPTAIEFMDRTSIAASCAYLNESLPWQQAGAMLLITVDGADVPEVTRQAHAVGKVAEESGAQAVYVADNRTTSERLWRVRRNIAEAFKVQSPRQSLEDIVVPIGAIPDMVAGLLKIAARFDIEIPCYGHAGDGNLHATPVMNPKWTLKEWRKTLPDILVEMYKLTISLGGTLSGEHGIGYKRKKYLPMALPSTNLATMRTIKKALDPNGVLNPGKVFDAGEAHA